jgi:MFS family permease
VTSALRRFLGQPAGRLLAEAGAGVERLTDELGGPARRRAITLLACVLGLSSADSGAIGAVAPQLEPALRIGTTQLGLLVTVSSLVGAAATVPVGGLVDRLPRVRLLVLSILAWAAAEALSGAATSYPMLLAFRVLVGGVTATAGPAVASLTGDLFPASERGRMYGYIVSGELLGAGFGILLAGELSGFLGWRVALAVLALPSLALAWALRHYLPEPARGGRSRLQPGDRVIRSARDVADGRVDPGASEPAAAEPLPDRDEVVAAQREDTVLREVEEAGVGPEETIVLDRRSGNLGLWEAIRYVLAVRTNLFVIISSSLGYFFFAGLRTFGLVFIRGYYGLGQGVATILLVFIGVGSIAGLVGGGRLADRLVRRGRFTARIMVGVVGLLAAGVALLPALLVPNLAAGIPLLLIAGIMIAAPNATLDAARLDVVPGPLWGRAEGVRTVLRNSLEAFAPLIFGIVAAIFGGRNGGFGAASGGLGSGHAGSGEVHGLQVAFLVMLGPLFAGGLLLARARRCYPVDVVSAGESERRMAPPAARSRPGAEPLRTGRGAAPG